MSVWAAPTAPERETRRVPLIDAYARRERRRFPFLSPKGRGGAWGYEPRMSRPLPLAVAAVAQGASVKARLDRSSRSKSALEGSTGAKCPV